MYPAVRPVALSLAIFTLFTGCAHTVQTPPPAPASPAPGKDFSAQKWLETRWIMEVLTTAEMGNRRLHVARWVKPATIAAASSSPEQQEALHKTVAEINTALAGLYSLTLAAPGSEQAASAQIQVVFAPQKEWPALGKKMGIGVTLPDQGADGLQFIAWNDKIEIQAGLVVIASSLSGTALEQTLLEEVFQTMGIRNDSGFFPDSVIYESGNDSGGLSHLSDRDKKLIRFLYQHVPPGTRPDGLAKLIDAHWQY